MLKRLGGSPLGRSGLVAAKVGAVAVIVVIQVVVLVAVAWAGPRLAARRRCVPRARRRGRSRSGRSTFAALGLLPRRDAPRGGDARAGQRPVPRGAAVRRDHRPDRGAAGRLATISDLLPAAALAELLRVALGSSADDLDQTLRRPAGVGGRRRSRSRPAPSAGTDGPRRPRPGGQSSASSRANWRPSVGHSRPPARTLTIGVAIADQDVDPPTALVGQPSLDLPDELGGQTLASVGLGYGDVVDPAASTVPGTHRRAHDPLATDGDEEGAGIAGLEHPQPGVVVAGRAEPRVVPQGTELVTVTRPVVAQLDRGRGLGFGFGAGAALAGRRRFAAAGSSGRWLRPALVAAACLGCRAPASSDVGAGPERASPRAALAASSVGNGPRTSGRPKSSVCSASRTIQPFEPCSTEKRSSPVT